MMHTFKEMVNYCIRIGLESHCSKPQRVARGTLKAIMEEIGLTLDEFMALL